jgi:hypothetical protein
LEIGCIIVLTSKPSSQFPSTFAALQELKVHEMKDNDRFNEFDYFYGLLRFCPFLSTLPKPLFPHESSRTGADGQGDIIEMEKLIKQRNSIMNETNPIKFVDMSHFHDPDRDYGNLCLQKCQINLCGCHHITTHRSSWL